MPPDGALMKLAQYFAVLPGWLRYGHGPKAVTDGEGRNVLLDLDPSKDRKLTRDEEERAQRAAATARAERTKQGKGKGKKQA